MPKSPNKKKSTIDKKKLNIQQNNKEIEKTKRITYNRNHNKVILDDEDEEDEQKNNKNEKKKKKFIYPKDEKEEDDTSFCSFSTNKTEDIHKSKSVIKQRKTIYRRDERTSSSRSKSKNPNTIKKYQKKNKSNKNIVNINKKVSKRRNNSKKNNNANLHVIFKNPFFKEITEEYKDESSISDNDDSKDSDFNIEEEIKSCKKRRKKKNKKKKFKKRRYRNGRLYME